LPTGKLKLALVGCGAIARFHLDGILDRQLPIEITAQSMRTTPEPKHSPAKPVPNLSPRSMKQSLAPISMPWI
jgi:hypothetical protein